LSSLRRGEQEVPITNFFIDKRPRRRWGKRKFLDKRYEGRGGGGTTLSFGIAEEIPLSKHRNHTGGLVYKIYRGGSRGAVVRQGKGGKGGGNGFQHAKGGTWRGGGSIISVSPEEMYPPTERELPKGIATLFSRKECR